MDDYLLIVSTIPFDHSARDQRKSKQGPRIRERLHEQQGKSEMSDESEGYCATFQVAVELLGKRWNGVILDALLGGAERFGQIRAAVPGLSDRLLTERLHQLEHEGLVSRRCPEPSGVPRYALTQKGSELAPVIEAVSNWGVKWVSVPD